jgi:hypothetical protein
MTVMAITTLLAALTMSICWDTHPLLYGVFLVIYLPLELTYLSATLAKMASGGWVSPLVAVIVSTIKLTWWWGSSLKAQHTRKNKVGGATGSAAAASVVSDPVVLWWWQWGKPKCRWFWWLLRFGVQALAHALAAEHMTCRGMHVNEANKSCTAVSPAQASPPLPPWWDPPAPSPTPLALMA